MMRYDPPTRTGTGTWPGRMLLVAELRRLWPGRSIGTFNARCTRGHAAAVGSRTCPYGHGISHHAECRAVDLMTSEPDVHAAVAGWAIGPDGRRWGIQEVITGFPQPRRWTVDGGWKPYTGLSPHRDHVHLSQTIDAARRTTDPVTAPLQPPRPPTGDDVHTTDILVSLDADGCGWRPVDGVKIEDAIAATLVVPNPQETGRYIAPTASARLSNQGGNARVTVTAGPPLSAVFVRVAHR